MKKYAKKKTLKLFRFWPLIVSLIVGILCGIYAIQAILTFVSWDEGGVASYQGEYILIEKNYLRNTNYLFVLGNGDTVEIPCEQMDDDFLLGNPALMFKYVNYKDIFVVGNHRPISVSSVDGKSVFYDVAVGRRELYIQVILFAPISVGLILFSGIPIYLNVLQYFLSLKKRMCRKKRTNFH